MNRLFQLPGVACLLTGCAIAQSQTGATVERLNFNRPEAWALKYFASATLLSGRPPSDTLLEERHTGSVAVGLETGWLPSLSPEQTRVGFSGRKREDLNKAPIFLRPTVTVGLPWRFSVIAAAPPPVQVFGVAPHLFALGLERPIMERTGWSLGWRAYGQLGSVKAAFTCPPSSLGYPARSPENPSGCIGESEDVASLRYAGTEIQFAHGISRIPRLSPFLGVGANLIDGRFQVHAPLQTGLDTDELRTRGKTFSGSAGASYRLTNRVSFTVAAFYTPLWVRRGSGAGRHNDGLFNVRALLSYRLR